MLLRSWGFVILKNNAHTLSTSITATYIIFLLISLLRHNFTITISQVCAAVTSFFFVCAIPPYRYRFLPICCCWFLWIFCASAVSQQLLSTKHILTPSTTTAGLVWSLEHLSNRRTINICQKKSCKTKNEINWTNPKNISKNKSSILLGYSQSARLPSAPAAVRISWLCAQWARSMIFLACAFG